MQKWKSDFFLVAYGYKCYVGFGLRMRRKGFSRIRGKGGMVAASVLWGDLLKRTYLSKFDAVFGLLCISVCVCVCVCGWTFQFRRCIVQV